MVRSLALPLSAALTLTTLGATALAQPDEPGSQPVAPDSAVAAPDASPPPPPAPPAPLPPPALRPLPAAPPEERALFMADPVLDGALIGGSLGAAVMLQLIVGTGEIRPQQISPDFQVSSLLSIDRPAVTQTIDPHAGTYSSIGLYAAVGYAVLDPILTGVRENSVKSALVDATIYGEASAMTTALTNIAKMAVRRPRPIAYIDFEKNIKTNPNYTNTDTDSALSFFSGHAAECGTITAVATYLAFARSPHSARPWVTLLVGTALTSFVSVERVRSGEHFTTDVIAGSFTGAGIGVLTAHLHRVDKVPPLWVGWQRANYGDGGALTLNGVL